MDLETGERYALLNGARLWREKKPIILVELHGPKTFDAAEEFLERFSYSGTEIHLGKSIKSVSDFINAENEGVLCTILSIPKP